MSSTYVIREFGIDDYESVYRLWSVTPGLGLSAGDDSREGVEKFLRRNPGMSFVAEENGNIAGAILCGHDGRRGYIHHTCVAESARGKGVGSKLTAAALDAFRREGIPKAKLVAFADNAKGNGFWEHMGFTERPDLIYRDKAL
ncbi:MAG: GNAT family N-acetyltransferase [Clostridiales bacterium]|jgi:ribosomal protein S18 acetylase RimI-like enzyme|nr:GNAT family N-acetyltransferase [Clostridiales bacterium]